MLINPYLIIISLLIILSVFIICNICKPKIPLLSGVAILLLTGYIIIAASINGVIDSGSSSVFSADFVNSLTLFATGAEELTVPQLERSFSVFCAAVIVLFIFTVACIVLDIKRICSEKYFSSGTAIKNNLKGREVSSLNRFL